MSHNKSVKLAKMLTIKGGVLLITSSFSLELNSCEVFPMAAGVSLEHLDITASGFYN